MKDMMILTILVYLICLTASDSGRHYLDYSDLEECEYNNIQGYCQELRNCPRLFRLLIRNRGRPSPKLLYILRSSHCGFNGREPIVCCPESHTLRIGSPVKNPEQEDASSDTSSLPKFCGRANINDKIIGGSEAGLNEFPWMALIGYETPQGLQYRCGGTLINRRYVLTAAHCLTNLKSIIPKSVRLGEHNLSSEVDCLEEGCASPSRDFPITRFIPHPEFRLKDLRNDIALIELAETVNYSKSIQPVCLPAGVAEKRRVLDGETLTIAGWGATENGMYSNVLRKAKIKVIPHQDCTDLYDGMLSVTKSQICAGGEGYLDSCSGDSGGPLKAIGYGSENEPVYVQYGLVSFGPRICGSPGKPGVYTRISSYIDWILKEIY